MKIVEVLKEFEFEQSVQGLSKKYIAWRMNERKTFTIDELFIDDVTEVTQRHIKLFIRYRQRLRREKNITIWRCQKYSLISWLRWTLSEKQIIQRLI
ncbi:MAG TPA: hypothetical protein VK072_06415 [Candidatus Avamphibacillus sp.]|nr:hypothetical protein [Candidatus Avamphibacillus sp.]